MKRGAKSSKEQAAAGAAKWAKEAMQRGDDIYAAKLSAEQGYTDEMMEAAKVCLFNTNSSQEQLDFLLSVPAAKQIMTIMLSFSLHFPHLTEEVHFLSEMFEEEMKSKGKW